MCGLTAFLASHQQDGQGDSMEDSAESTIDASLDLVKHRGPDARGKWLSPDRRVGKWRW